MSNTEGGLARSIRRHRVALLGILVMMILVGVMLAFLPVGQELEDEADTETGAPAETSATVGLPEGALAPEGEQAAGNADDAAGESGEVTETDTDSRSDEVAPDNEAGAPDAGESGPAP